MSQNTILLLCVGGILLGLIAVVIDRLNFPQRKFVPKSVVIDPADPKGSRDRTGAHIVDLDPEESPDP